MSVLPSQLLAAWKNGLRPRGPVAWDTETSGLHVDAGARVSTVSVAFVDEWVFEEDIEEFGNYPWAEYLEVTQGERAQELWTSGVWTYGPEVIAEGDPVEFVISFAWPFDQGVEGTGKKEDSGQALLWQDTENLPEAEWRALLEWLELVGEDVGLTAHHAKFDLHQTAAGVRRWPGVGARLEKYVDWDTQNVADVLTGRFGTTSLKPTAERYWGAQEKSEQEVVKKYLAQRKLPKGRWDLMPWDVIALYADQDARLTCRLRLRQELDLDREAGVVGWFDGQNGRMTPQEAVARRLRATKMLHRMERRGLPWNVDGAKAASAEIHRRIRKLEAELPFKPATLPNAKQYWFGSGVKRGVEGMELTPYSTTEAGEPQLTVQVVAKMVADGVPHAKTWGDIQKLQTSLSRWYEGWTERAGKDGRLRTSVRQNGTVSGRFSVENIQLQAIPQDYKLSGFDVLDGVPTPRALIGEGVPEGWELWELDLAQAELRVAAQYAGCQRMLDLINQGADLHAQTVKDLFHTDESDPKWFELRQVSKRANFSLIFGVGWETFQTDLEEQTGIRLTDSEAQRIVKDWNALYPEYKRAIYGTMRELEARGNKGRYGRGWSYVTLANGERRWFKPFEQLHKGFNQRVQPNLAQFGLDWWLWAEELLMDELGDEPVTREHYPQEAVDYVGRVGMVLTVHDSMVLLLPKGEVGERLVETIVEYGKWLWSQRFPGVPGDIDAKHWVKAA